MELVETLILYFNPVCSCSSLAFSFFYHSDCCFPTIILELLGFRDYQHGVHDREHLCDYHSGRHWRCIVWFRYFLHVSHVSSAILITLISEYIEIRLF